MAYEMRISDWSSDVCSSDLRLAGPPRASRRAPPQAPPPVSSPSRPPPCRSAALGFPSSAAALLRAALPTGVEPLAPGLRDRLSLTGGSRPACGAAPALLSEARLPPRSEEHTSELQSLMRISYAVFCLKKKKKKTKIKPAR